MVRRGSADAASMRRGLLFFFEVGVDRAARRRDTAADHLRIAAAAPVKRAVQLFCIVPHFDRLRRCNIVVARRRRCRQTRRKHRRISWRLRLPACASRRYRAAARIRRNRPRSHRAMPRCGRRARGGAPPRRVLRSRGTRIIARPPRESHICFAERAAEMRRAAANFA